MAEKTSNEPIYYLPFTSDYGFKVTFGNEHDSVFLRRALQALINTSVPIEEIWFDKNTIEGLTLESRSGILDLYCRDAHSNLFIVEMQLGVYVEIIQRLKFYAFHKLDKEIRKGKFEFKDLSKIYCIAILGYNLLPGNQYHTIACIRAENGYIVDTKLDFVIVELAKFKKKSEDCITDLDKLLFAMNETHHIEIGAEVPAFMKEDWIVKALHELDTSSMSPDRRADLSIFLAKELSERHFNHTNKIRAEQAEANLEIERAKTKEAAELAQQERVKAQASAEMAQKERAKAIEMEQQINLAIQNLIDQPDWSDARIASTFQVSLEHIQPIRSQSKA